MFLAACLGCESKEFKAERQLWHAHRMAQAVYKDPRGTKPLQLAKAQEAYRDIIKRYPGSLFAIQSRLGLGNLYLAKREFQKARQEYQGLVDGCGRRENLCAQGLMAISNSYEREGRWEEALGGYRKIMQEYPFSSKALDLPLRVIRHYSRAKDEKGLQNSVDEAVAYYLGLKEKSRASRGGHMFDSLIARSYIEGMRWQEALDALEKIVRDYPKSNPEEALFLKALIYQNKLKDPLKAKEEFLRISRDYPHSKVSQKIEAFLKKP